MFILPALVSRSSCPSVPERIVKMMAEAHELPENSTTVVLKDVDVLMIFLHHQLTLLIDYIKLIESFFRLL